MAVEWNNGIWLLATFLFFALFAICKMDIWRCLGGWMGGWRCRRVKGGKDGWERHGFACFACLRARVQR
ncbi:hypothetical protein DL95DRAFT_43395 [Leptodontidium sp. 2 PMI_412]|nr:hypothetical protein DL95DRAFT_43395 [Leptodontidium sp. 2 PMI_412]